MSHHYEAIKYSLLDFRKEEDYEHVKLWIDEYVAELDNFIEQGKLQEERDGF